MYITPASCDKFPKILKFLMTTNCIILNPSGTPMRFILQNSSMIRIKITHPCWNFSCQKKKAAW